MPARNTAQIHFTLAKSDKNQLENLLKTKYSTNITNIFKMIAEQIIITRQIPFDYETTWCNWMANKIVKLAERKPTEKVRTDRHDHILNTKDCPDFVAWLKNG